MSIFAFLDGLWPFAVIGFAIFFTIIAIIVCLAANLLEPVWAWVKNDDTLHMLKNKLADLEGWSPKIPQLDVFIRASLCPRLHLKSHEVKLLARLICYLLAYDQEQSSLVIGETEYDDQKLWMRFLWAGEWWVLWYGSKKNKPPKFRAFPEIWIENEIQSEDIGDIIAFRTISYAEVKSYFQ